jgi:predicted nuclease with TOPRIM domain
MQTKRDRLEELRAKFDELTESLELSGKKRVGSTWQTDRLKAREQIRREMEDLEHIPPVPTFNPAEY